VTCCAAAYDFDARFNYNFDANCLNTVTHTRNDNRGTTTTRTNCLPPVGKLGGGKSQEENAKPHMCDVAMGRGPPHKGLGRQDRQDNGQRTGTHSPSLPPEAKHGQPKSRNHMPQAPVKKIHRGNSGKHRI